MSSPTMMPMSLTEIAQAVDGRLMPTTVPTDEPVAISAFTDSRQIVPGSVFVAIAGERVDGHDFVPKVGAQGAVAALVDHEIAGAQVPQIVVENTVKALGAASICFRQNPTIPAYGALPELPFNSRWNRDYCSMKRVKPSLRNRLCITDWRIRDFGVGMVHTEEFLCFRSGVRPGKRHLQDVERG